MMRVAWGELENFGTLLLKAKGVPERTARYISETAVKTEAFGATTHGLAVWGYLAEQIGAKIDPAAQPEMVAEHGASAVIEGNGGIGQAAMEKAVQFAMDNAPKQGVAMVAVRNVSWLGALGVYLMPLAERGLLAQMWAQTSACRDCAPLGGIDARFSTNPMALAFPTGGDPVIADFSTASMSMGKAGQLQRAGRRAPEKVFMDKEGRLTDDPNVMRNDGTMLFLGGEHFGHKGYALSLWCEALTALAGGRCNDPDSPSRQNFCLMAAAPELFAGRERYDKEMKRFIAHVRSSRVRVGFEAVRLPGERGYRALREAKQKGVPVDDARLKQLRDLAARLNVPWKIAVA